MRYLGLFIISFLFTLNLFAEDVCQDALVVNICNPTWAAEKATLTEVQSLINQGIDFEQKCSNGTTPLSLLSERAFYFPLLEQLRDQKRLGERFIQIIKSDSERRDPYFKRKFIDEFLFEHRKLPLNPANYRSREDGRTPLIWAAHRGFIWVVDILLNPFLSLPNEATVDIPDNEGKTALMHAAIAKDFYLFLHGHSMAQLLSEGASINAQDHEGKTPLMHAVLTSKKRIKIKILIEKGADMDVEDHQGNTAIKHAARVGRCWAVNFLRSKGATYNPTEIDRLLNSVPWHTRLSWDVGQYIREWDVEQYIRNWDFGEYRGC